VYQPAGGEDGWLNLFRFTPLDNNYIRGYRTEKSSYPTGFIQVRVAVIMKIIKGVLARVLQKLDTFNFLLFKLTA